MSLLLLLPPPLDICLAPSPACPHCLSHQLLLLN